MEEPRPSVKTVVHVEAQQPPEAAPLEETFKPTGAIAFFVLLVLLSLVTWFGIYFLMLSRV